MVLADPAAVIAGEAHLIVVWSGIGLRLPQPLHRELVIARLQVPPAFHFGLVPGPWEIARNTPAPAAGPRGVLPLEFLPDEGVLGHGGGPMGWPCQLML